MKKFLPVFFSILTVLLIIGCNNNYAPFRPTADIVFEPALPENPLRLSVNKTCQIHAKVIYDNATDKNLIYSSADDSIASVDDKGVVTAHKTGDTKITIKASNGVSKEITVTVTTTHIPVTGIALRSGETAISVENGATRQIGAYVVPENATDKTLTYSSDDETVAVVNDKGEITAKQDGSTVITITAADDPTVSKKVRLTVTKATVRVTSIEFNPPLPAEPIELFLNEIYKFDIKVLPEGAENKNLTFKSSKTSVAWLCGDGNRDVKADGEGKATVTITADDNPSVSVVVHFKMMRKPEGPSINIETPVVEYESDEANITVAVKTLNGKLAYTPEVVGGGTGEKAWLTFVSKDNTNANTDTVHLRLKQNKTVWDRTAYIKFKDNTNKYIISAGKELQVELTQKKNDNPNVTIKWVDGIGEPNPSEKERIPVYGGEKKVYWNDDKIFWWNESTTTKWFNNRKVSLLGIAAPEGADGNQCWAKTASNMLHWWFVQNEANINKYIKNKSQEEKDKYAHYYKRELPTAREKEKSYIANSFRIQASNSQQGNYTISGLAWYLYGNPSVSNKNFEGPSLFKDIFSKENTPIKVETVTDQTSFNEIISKALESKKAIGIDIWGSKGVNDYAHAITLWGAAFDEEGNIIAIYVVDNNFEQNRIFPYGIWYKEGKPYLFNYGVNSFVQNRYVGRVTTLDKGEAQWAEWKSNHP
ncbi:IdeS/Mac family cysteine endopeptidase [Treponema sp. OMZ 855]|uniref:IdeS/Mac family cysteine endopeptidase n=1 Tax=Treponema sp. OMZ 855 TaxID=1643512 RepID=UPI0020A513A8|nr:IdeS/Mac family cysteine endopeptidase [Treponema sp. OMZ 855]UTC50067.1 Ig-like domain-containing protein [Treponema sp. OMZ 855]